MTAAKETTKWRVRKTSEETITQSLVVRQTINNQASEPTRRLSETREHVSATTGMRKL